MNDISIVLQDEDIVRYDDHCLMDYQLTWHLNSHLCLHHGYWDQETFSHREAVENMNRKVAEAAGLKNGQYILDAGCGVGGSSLFLAREYGCKVHGITLSARQVSFARREASKRKLENQVQFSVGNFVQTGLDENQFDIVWAVESVCHLVDKSAFLKEAKRLLKPGGRLIVADFFRNHPTLSDHPLLDKWAASRMVPSFEALPEFISQAYSTGFTKIDSRNITKNIYRSSRRLYNYYRPVFFLQSALEKLGVRNQYHRLFVTSALYQFQALKENLWSYHLVSMKKKKKESE